MSEDPKASLNPYPYVSNNPYNKVDPTGAEEAPACGHFEWPPLWEQFEKDLLLKRQFSYRDEFKALITKRERPGGNEYSLVVGAVAANEETYTALKWAIAEVANKYYVASCALAGNTDVPG